MFPWSPEFKWDAYHAAFFGALYSVIATVAGTLAFAAWRAWRDARSGRAAAIAWHGDFAELPRSARPCRHQLTGEAPGRVQPTLLMATQANLRQINARMALADVEMRMGEKQRSRDAYLAAIGLNPTDVGIRLDGLHRFNSIIGMKGFDLV
jgi:hypothetical protein